MQTGFLIKYTKGKTVSSVHSQLHSTKCRWSVLHFGHFNRSI